MTTISYQITGVVTNAGIAAAIAAGQSGPKIDIAGFRLGSLSAAEGSVALVTDTDVDGFVYAGDTTGLTYSQIDTDTVVWRIDLEPSVGNFQIGNLGLVTSSGALFCKATLPGQSNKYASAPPAVLGNRKFFNIVMRLDNVGNLLNLSLIESTEASLPEVATELLLPAALTTPYDAWLVDNHTHLGVPTTAVRVNGGWLHSPYHANPGEAHSEFAMIPALFSADLTGKVIAYNTATQLLVPADPSVNLGAIGIAMNTSRVVVVGQVPASVLGISGTIVPFTFYYVGAGANAGELSTTPMGSPVAVAVSTSDLFVDLSGNFIGGYEGGNSVVIPVSGDIMDAGLLPGAPVYPTLVSGSTTQRVWHAADPSITSERPVGILDGTKANVVIVGTVTVPITGSAWPVPLTMAQLTFAGEGLNAGLVTPWGNWLIGEAVDPYTISVNQSPFASVADHITAVTASNPISVKNATPAGVVAMLNYMRGNFQFAWGDQRTVGGLGTIAHPFYTISQYQVTPLVIPNGIQGAAYANIQLALTSSVGAVAFTETTGSLAGSGLSLSSTGLLSFGGLPGTTGTWTFGVHAQDSLGNWGYQNYSIIIGSPVVVHPSSGPLPNAIQNASYSQLITATGGTAPYTFSISSGALPSGLPIASSGYITGRPTGTGVYSFTVTATDVNGYTGSQSYSIEVDVVTPGVQVFNGTAPVAAQAGATSVPPAAATIAAFTVPTFNTLTVQCWGGGGGGGGGSPILGNAANGGNTVVGSMIAGGGGGGTNSPGVAGSATGGSVNTPGQAGTGIEDNGGGWGFTGGAGANGGAGGGGLNQGGPDTGQNGQAPGGGGGGGGSYGPVGQGGGGGGYTSTTYTTGQLTVGQVLALNIGGGGQGGDGSGSAFGNSEGGGGAPGRVTISWN